MKGPNVSRIYFHTQTEMAAIRDSERGWLRAVAANAAFRWWGLDDSNPIDRALAIADMIVPMPETQYVVERARMIRGVADRIRDADEAIFNDTNHTTLIKGYAQQTRDEATRFHETWKRYAVSGLDPIRNVHHDPRSKDALVDVLRTCLCVNNVLLRVAGCDIWSMDVEMNTALLVGNEYVQLAAKTHGWCEVHAWIEESDRVWLADVIEDGVDTGVYRRGLWYQNGAREYHEQGWGDVVALLRNTTDHPGEVVLSYSGSDEFPNPDIATTMPPWPDGVPERWDDLSSEQQVELKDARDRWYALPGDERWKTAMDGLRERRPWANIAEDNVGTVTFGPNITLFDLFHHDRDARVNAACTPELEGRTDG